MVKTILLLFVIEVLLMVRLTLVGSYPFLGFRLNGLVVYDDMEASPYDTLAAIDAFTVTVDFKTLYKERKIILTNLFIGPPSLVPAVRQAPVSDR